MTAGDYADGGAAGVGIFRQDTGWGSPAYAAEIQVNAVPEPASMALFAVGSLAMLAGWRRWR